MMKTITICGGGALGHVVAGWLSSKGKADVRVLTQHPAQWHDEIMVDTPDGEILCGRMTRVSDDACEVVSGADVVLLCLPGFLIPQTLVSIKPYLGCQTFVGSVFSSTGFFFEAMRLLDKSQPLWGFQRVPFISRVSSYGSSAHLLGYKTAYQVAIEHVGDCEKAEFAHVLEDWFERPVEVLDNYLEASLTNSNPLLHTARLYTMFGGQNEGRAYDRMIRFYEEWTEESAAMLIEMDAEFFQLLKVLPVRQNSLPTILDYYESHDAHSLACKLSSIEGFKGINSPMKQQGEVWVPDFQSRYFTEDFPYGLRYIYQLARQHDVACPHIDEVFHWGMHKIGLWHA